MPMPAIPRRLPPPNGKACEFRCVRDANADSSYEPGPPRHRGARCVTLADPRPGRRLRQPPGGATSGGGGTTILRQLRDRRGRGTVQHIDVERTATTPERFLQAVTAVSPFPAS